MGFLKKFTRRICQVLNKVLNAPSRTQTRHQDSAPYASTTLTPPSFPGRLGLSILQNGRSEGSRPQTGKDERQRTLSTYYPLTSADWCDVGRRTNNMLPDDILLEIFDFYMIEANRHNMSGEERWQILTHVC